MVTDWLMVIITAIYVVATIFICIYNGKSAKAAKEQTEVAQRQTKEMIKQYEAVNRPFVTIRFDIIRSGLLCFVIENEGPMPAHDVCININQSFIDNIQDSGDRGRLEELNDASFYLASKQKMTILIGGQPAFANIAKEVAKIDISYDSFKEHTEIDINQYRFLLVYNSPVEDISQHLKKIRDNDEKFHKKIIKEMEKKPQVQNIVLHKAIVDDANKLKIYKHVCIEPHQTIGQIAEKLEMEKEYVLDLLMELYKVDRLVAFTFHGVETDDGKALWYKRQ